MFCWLHRFFLITFKLYLKNDLWCGSVPPYCVKKIIAEKRIFIVFFCCLWTLFFAIRWKWLATLGNNFAKICITKYHLVLSIYCILFDFVLFIYDCFCIVKSYKIYFFLLQKRVFMQYYIAHYSLHALIPRKKVTRIFMFSYYCNTNTKKITFWEGTYPVCQI